MRQWLTGVDRLTKILRRYKDKEAIDQLKAQRKRLGDLLAGLGLDEKGRDKMRMCSSDTISLTFFFHAFFFFFLRGRYTQGSQRGTQVSRHQRSDRTPEGLSAGTTRPSNPWPLVDSRCFSPHSRP
jgi:hypothetical protein